MIGEDVGGLEPENIVLHADVLTGPRGRSGEKPRGSERSNPAAGAWIAVAAQARSRATSRSTCGIGVSGGDAMAEVEDVRAGPEGGADVVHRLVERPAAGDQGLGVEVALHREAGRQDLVGPMRIDHDVEPQSRHAG